MDKNIVHDTRDPGVGDVEVPVRTIHVTSIYFSDLVRCQLDRGLQQTCRRSLKVLPSEYDAIAGYELAIP